MSSPGQPPADSKSESGQSPGKDNPAPWPNLTVIYSMIGFALAAAIALALMIVLPFHHRH
ncbi:MAG: hypothetical protein ABSG51_14755 [Terracidiphilus sp.]|jgi:hypothetical protein